jgi:hypothetical protein
MRLLWVLILLTCGACASLRQDPAPSPIDPGIGQTRIEFSGCGQDSQIGMITCVPLQTVSVVTEFPGDVIFFASGTNPGVDCSIKQQIRATPPLTALNLSYSSTSSCAVTVYYLPEYPGTQSSIYPTAGLYGQVVLQPDTNFKIGGNFSLTTSELLSIKIPDAIHGEYQNRTLNAPVLFSGNTVSYRPSLNGLDVIYIKYWDLTNTAQHEVCTANYYSPMAIQLRFDQAGTKLTFSDFVSIITVNGEIHRDYRVSLPDNFTGYVRAYTVQGRTLVSYFSGGNLQWSQ